MGFYRKKPRVIEAIQVKEKLNLSELPQWFKDAAKNNKIAINILSPDEEIDYIEINTLEGTMIATIGDWIIQGVKGELYPCKDNIFKETYEEVKKYEET